MKKVAFQGERGAYSEEAIYKHYGTEVKSIPRPSLKAVFNIVENGDADYGLIPVENTIEGTIARSYDLLNECSLKVSGEEIHRIQHCLIAHKDSEIKDIKRAYSHPQALGQSREYLDNKGIEAVEFYDTAGSVKWIKENNIRDTAGIASAHAAKIYGMKILKKGIESNPENYTRFLEISFNEPQLTGSDKTSLAFVIQNKPGKLVAAIKEFSNRGINIEKIETRPIIGKPWEYIFFMDVEGHVNDDMLSSALDALKNNSNHFKLLGSYPRAGFS
jgi:prephenate dehydratase